jgi:hypothetical protein
MNADPNYISIFNVLWVYLSERFIHQNRISEAGWCGGRKYVLPTGCDNGSTERNSAGIDEVNGQRGAPWSDECPVA